MNVHSLGNVIYQFIPILGDGHQTIFIDDENPGLGGPKSGAEAQIIGTDHMLDKNNICKIIYILYYIIIIVIIIIIYIINIYIYY